MMTILQKMKGDFENLKLINEELPTKSLGEDDIKYLDSLFNELDKKPKLSLLGKSGSGKSTLINRIIGDNVLAVKTGTGAVTQYPVELIYRTNIGFTITKDDCIETQQLLDLLKEHRDLLNDNEELQEDVLNEIYKYIDTMNQWEIPYEAPAVRLNSQLR